LIDQTGQHHGLPFSDSHRGRQLLKIDHRIGNGLGSSAGGWKFYLYFIFDSGDGGNNEQRNDAIL
jgi:hypothetical protein